MSARFTAACVQLTAGPEIGPNVERATGLIHEARKRGADFIALPENATMIEPDLVTALKKAPPEPEHPGLAIFCALASETGAWILGGSITVRASDGRVANRSLLFDPSGAVAGRYDKIHMFDVDLPDGETYRESDTYRPGAETCVAPTPWGGLGMTVCYDVRFPALYRMLAKAGADFIAVPSAFTRQTGRAHWSVLLRARAIETGECPAIC